MMLFKTKAGIIKKNYANALFKEKVILLQAVNQNTLILVAGTFN
jgi:hypothetical protein